MKKITKNICRISLIGSLIGGQVLPVEVDVANRLNDTKVAYQMNSEFKDITTDSSAYEAIAWAKNRNIISQNADGAFKLSALITEAEFAKMLSTFLILKDEPRKLVKQTPESHWADEYYNQLATYGTPLNGYFDNTLRDKLVKRGVVVHAIGHLTGNTTSLSEAINLMTMKGVKTGPVFPFECQLFGLTNDLTRAQVAVLLYQLHKVGLEEATVAVEKREDISLVALANKGISTLDSSFRLGELGTENVYIPINPLMQEPELPNGCEIVSLTALLNYFGYDVSKTTMADQYLPKQAFRLIDGKIYGPNPYIAYAGNPRSKKFGWYSFAPPIVEAADRYMATQTNKMKAINISGSSKEKILSLLNNGVPVVIWITLDLSKPTLNGHWYLNDTGQYYKAYTNLHVVVLNGYKEDVVHVMNPLKGQVEYNMDAFFKSYEEMGKHAVVLEKEEAL